MIDMMNSNDVRTSLEALANKFEKSDPKAANRLRNLRSAVGRGSNADAWAVSDVYRLIEPELIIEHYKNQHTTDTFVVVVEWLRNCLIFAPLVITWFGISQAVEQYSALIKAEPNQISEPFLYLWQNGFGNRLQSWQTLGGIATIDFVLLGLVFLLTIIVYSLSSTIKLKREHEAEELRVELADTIACAALCLATRNWQQPTDFVARFDQSAKFFSLAVEQLLTRIEALANMQQQDHQTFNTFRQDLATIMDGVSASVKELKISNEALRRSMAALTAPTSKVSESLGSLTVSAQEAVNLYKAQVEGLRVVIETLQQWGGSLQNVLGKLDITVQAASNMANEINRFTQKEEELVQNIAQQGALQTQISSRMVAATDRLEHIVPLLHKCAVELNGVNVQLDDVARRVADLMARVPR